MARSTQAEKSIGEELLAASGIGKKRPRETMVDYQKRLFQECDALSDEKFESLSTPAQNYLNAGIIIHAISVEDEEVSIGDKTYKNGQDIEFLDQEYEWGEPLDFEGKKYEWGALIEIPGLVEGSEQRLSKAKDGEEKEAPPEKRGRGRPAGVSNKPKENGGAKGVKASGERKPREINRTGGVYKIKEAVLKDLSATNDEIRKKLADAGVEVSITTVQGIRSDFLHSLRVLDDKGKLQGVSLN